MTTRQGPRLTIAGSCEECEHLARGVRDPVLRGAHTACTHPSRANGGTIFARARGAVAMPDWCPELPAARLALARGIVAAAQPSALDLVPPDEAAIHQRMGSTPIIDADAVMGRELRVYPKEQPK